MRPSTSPHQRVRLLLQRLEDRTAPAVIPLSLADPTMLAANGNGNQNYGGEVLSRDGRYVAFVSTATNLVDGEVENNYYANDPNVFLFDRGTGLMTLVSHAAGSATTTSNGRSFYAPSISDDGRFVVYTSDAGDLVGNNPHGQNTNVYLYDRLSGTNSLVSHASGSPAALAAGDSPVISGDGRYVTYVGDATTHVAGGTGRGLMLYDRLTGLNLLVSHVFGSALTAANGASGSPAISSDGRLIAYHSTSTNLATGIADGNGAADVFLYDRVSDTNTIVSRWAGTVATGNAKSEAPVISGDGRYVAFRSSATDLVSGQIDSASTPDVFLYDRVTSGLSLVTHIPTSLTTAGSQPPKGSVSYSLSDDGSVAFASYATNLVGKTPDRNESSDVFLYDPASARVTLVSRSGVKAGAPANGPSYVSAISGDGRYVGFGSLASDLFPGQIDTNRSFDAFLYDRVTGRTVLVSHAIGNTARSAALGSYSLTLSRDGSVAACNSEAANLAPRVFGHSSNVFVYDRATATNTLVSRHAASMPVLTGSGHSEGPAVSADGRFVVFVSGATNLLSGQVDPGDSTGYGAQNVFVYDRQTGRRTLVSHAADSATTGGGGLSFQAGISADGRYVVYQSTAGDVIAGQTRDSRNTKLYLFDRVTGTTTFVAQLIQGYSLVDAPSISADGRYVAFVSWATNLVNGQTDSTDGTDVFLFDRVTSAITLVSHRPGSATTAGGGYLPKISGDGRYIVYGGYATSPAGAPNVTSSPDLILFDRLTGTNTPIARTVQGAPGRG